MPTVASPAVRFQSNVPTTQASDGPRFPGFVNLSDDQLIDIAGGIAWFNAGEREDAVAEAAAELVRRLDNWQPSPREQEQLEASAVVIAGEPDAPARRVVIEQQDGERWDMCA